MKMIVSTASSWAKKNRKLRRLRALYPDLRIKLFYARDFRALMLKYGKLALVDSLSGTSGQVVPERGVAVDPAEDLPEAVVPRVEAPRSRRPEGRAQEEPSIR